MCGRPVRPHLRRGTLGRATRNSVFLSLRLTPGLHGSAPPRKRGEIAAVPKSNRAPSRVGIPFPVKFDTSRTKREAQARKGLGDLACASRLVWFPAGIGIQTAYCRRSESIAVGYPVNHTRQPSSRVLLFPLAQLMSTGKQDYSCY